MKQMDELIRKVEARISACRDELEGWKNTSQMVSGAIESEVEFLEALLAEMKAMAK
jgi:hypothetical protein